MAGEALIELLNISKTYALGKTVIHALRTVSFEIEKNDFMVIAGPSGSGKTTMLNLIGMIDKPTSGYLRFGTTHIIFNNLNSLSRFRRDRLGYIFQHFNLIPVFTVYENVEYPLILQKISKNERKKRVEEILEKTGLLERRKHFPLELSGGQRQRISIARAVVKKPDIILADEPTANLDSKTGRQIIDLMEKMNQEDGLTFLFSSHDPDIIKQAKKIVCLSDGRIEQIYTRKDTLRRIR